MPIDAKFAAFSKLQSVYELLLNLRPHAGHSESSSLLWGILKKTVDHMIEEVVLLDGSNEREVAIIGRYSEIGDDFLFYLRLLEAGEANRIPNVIISPLQNVIQQEAPGAKVVVWCDWIPSNYSACATAGRHLRNTVEFVFKDSENEVVKSVPSVLAVMSFPAADKQNILLHSALGHEVGHVLSEHCRHVNGYTEHGSVQLDEQELRNAAQHQMDVMGLTNCGIKATDNLFFQKYYEDIRASATKMLRQWLGELLADAYSIYLLGPAPLLALYELRSIQQPSQTHPPSCLRYPVMLECLKLSNFYGRADDDELKWLEQKLNEIEATCSQPPFMEDFLFRIVFNCLQQHTSRIAAYIMKPSNRGLTNLSAKPYSYEDWSKIYLPTSTGLGTKNALVDRVLNYVIPDAIDKTPADLPSILNTGWAVFYGYWEQFCKGLGTLDLPQQYRARQKLFNLLLKAIEAADLKQRWSSYYDTER